MLEHQIKIIGAMLAGYFRGLAHGTVELWSKDLLRRFEFVDVENAVLYTARTEPEVALSHLENAAKMERLKRIALEREKEKHTHMLKSLETGCSERTSRLGAKIGMDIAMGKITCPREQAYDEFFKEEMKRRVEAEEKECITT